MKSWSNVSLRGRVQKSCSRNLLGLRIARKWIMTGVGVWYGAMLLVRFMLHIQSCGHPSSFHESLNLKITWTWFCSLHSSSNYKCTSLATLDKHFEQYSTWNLLHNMNCTIWMALSDINSKRGQNINAVIRKKFWMKCEAGKFSSAS